MISIHDAPLPHCWCWTSLHELLLVPLMNGRSVPDASNPQSGFPVLRLTALKSGTVDLHERKLGAWSVEQAAKFLVHQNDFFVARGNGSKSLVGRGALVVDQPDAIAFPDTLIRVRTDDRFITPTYLQLVWNSEILRQQIESTARTTAGIYKINQQDMEGFRIPLPALPEQRRILAEIETQFTRLDAAVAALERARANLKRYRAAVLASACSGTLVHRSSIESNGRESANALIDRLLDLRSARVPFRNAVPLEPIETDGSVPADWAVASLDQMCERITSGSRDWSKYYGRGSGTFLMAQNIRPMRLDLRFRQPVDPPANSPDRARSQVEVGDLLVTIVGAGTGTVCRVSTPLPEHYVCQSVALLRPVDSGLAAYLEIYLNSDEHGRRQFDSFMYGQGRPHLGFDQIRSTRIMLPPPEEQQRIVEEAQRRLSNIERIEAAIYSNLTRAERLRQSILRKAFAGELVPQDPNDEPANVLLERIRAVQAAPSSAKKSKATSRKRTGKSSEIQHALL